MTRSPKGSLGAPGVLVGLAVVAFVGLGLPEGAIGVAFPAIRETFSQPVSALGLLLVPYTGGYIAATIAHGRVHARVRVGTILVAAAACSCVGATFFVVGPVFGVLMIGSFLLGASAGGIDASLNSYVSLHLDHRVLAFMHAGFGIGATLGPFGVTALLHRGASWRVAYAVLAFAQVVLGLAWWRVRHLFVRGPAEHPPAATTERVVAFEGDVAEADLAAPDAALEPEHGRARHLLQVTMFFLYTGTEGSTGILVATLLTARGLDATTAGLLTTAYWAALAVGRLLTGAVGPRVTPQRALSGAVVGVCTGLTLVWAGGTGVAGIGLLVVGFSLAPMFPSLVSLTPARVGRSHAGAAIGFQLAAASLGVATVPSLIGVLADRAGPAAIAPALLGVGVALAAAHVVTSLVAGDLRSPVPVR